MFNLLSRNDDTLSSRIDDSLIWRHVLNTRAEHNKLADLLINFRESKDTEFCYVKSFQWWRQRSALMVSGGCDCNSEINYMNAPITDSILVWRMFFAV